MSNLLVFFLSFQSNVEYLNDTIYICKIVNMLMHTNEWSLILKVVSLMKNVIYIIKE